MNVTKETAKRALSVFRKEQKARTVGTYTGCYCAGCVECMRLAIEAIIEEEFRRRPE